MLVWWGSHLKLEGKRLKKLSRSNVRVQVLPFETHIMVLMVETSPKVHALLGKVIFIRASLDVNTKAYSSVAADWKSKHWNGYL